MEPVPTTALATRPAAVDDGPYGAATLRARLGVATAPLTRRVAGPQKRQNPRFDRGFCLA